MKKLFILVLVMAALLSVTVFCSAAETPQVCVAGVEITAENAADVLGDGSVVYDAATGTLTLTDAAITAENLPYGIYAEGDLTIHLVGENTLTVSGEAPDCKELTGIFVGGKLTVTGDGSLYVSVSGNPAETVYGIHVGGYADILCRDLGAFVEETKAAKAYGIKVDSGDLLLAKGGDHYFGVGGATEYAWGMDVNGNIQCHAEVYVSDGHSWLENACGVHADTIYITDCWFESTFPTAFIADTGIYHTDEIYLWGTADKFTPGTPVTLTKNENSWSYVTFGWHEYDVGVGDVEVTSLNKHDVLGDGTVSYDNKTYTLTLNNAHIEGSIDAYEGVNIILKGENTITSIVPDHEHAIYGSAISMLSGSGSIYGPGSLDIYLYGNNTEELYAIYLAGNNTIRDCEINITVAGENNYDAKGILNAGAPLTIENSKINVDMSGCTGNNTGIWSYQELSAFYSNISVLGADKAYKVSDGVITVGYNLAVSGSKESFVNGTMDTLTPENPNVPVVIAPYQTSTSGTCGENLTWNLDKEGVLIISGTGPMTEGREFWANRADIKSVSISEGVTSISMYAFEGCINLTSVTIPDSVTVIEEEAFRGCTRLTSVTLPSNLTALNRGAFWDCTALQSVTLPKTLTSIEYYAFLNCRSLTGIWVEEGNPAFSNDEYGVLFNHDKTTLYQAPGALSGDYRIPDSVTLLDERAFASCHQLTSVFIPESVEAMNWFIFEDCSSLTGIWVDKNNPFYFNDGNGILYHHYNEGMVSLDYVPASFSGSFIVPKDVTYINWYAFSGCKELTHVTIPEGVDHIDWGTFMNCESLTSVTIPASVTEIREYAFEGCENLELVWFRGTQKQYFNMWLADSCHDPNCIHPGCRKILVQAKWHYEVTDLVIDEQNAYLCAECGLCFLPDGTQIIANPTLTATGYTLSFENSIHVNFYYTAEQPESIVEQGMLVFYADPGEADFAKADEVQKSQYVVSSDSYMASSYGIAAKEMGDDHYYCAYAKLTDGTYVYSQLHSYSPKQYAMNRLANSDDQDLKALCVALLNYGSAAQEYFGYRTDDLMNKDLTAEHKALVRAYDPSLFTGAVAADSPLMKEYASTGTGFSHKSASVSFRGNIAINYYFTPTEEVVSTMLFYGFRTRDLTIPGITIATGMEPQENGSYYQCFDLITPKELDDTFYVVAMYYDTNGNYHCTGLIPYSISQYCMNTANSPTMGKLSQATAMYGYYAKQYFTN